MRCWFFRRDLTALVDGELSPARAAAVRTHISGCAACAALHQGIETSVARQRQLVSLAFGPLDVASAGMLRSVHDRFEHEPSVRRWFLQPAMMGGIAVVTAIIATYLGVLDPVFISIGFENPPEIVAEQPELFRDYVFFERLDALEHFDDVNSIQLRKASADQPQG
jgi:predicted anti-sigma-YlaC factor YlaD